MMAPDLLGGSKRVIATPAYRVDPVANPIRIAAAGNVATGTISARPIFADNLNTQTPPLG